MAKALAVLMLVAASVPAGAAVPLCNRPGALRGVWDLQVVQTVDASTTHLTCTMVVRGRVRYDLTAEMSCLDPELEDVLPPQTQTFRAGFANERCRWTINHEQSSEAIHLRLNEAASGLIGSGHMSPLFDGLDDGTSLSIMGIHRGR